MGNIHPYAIVEKGAKIGKDVTIEPFAIVKKNVALGDRVTIKSHAYIDGNTTIGEGTIIYPGASIGTDPQDLKYKGEKTFVKIGKNCVIREYVTINSSCEEGSEVSIGDQCLLMAYAHVAHDCQIGNRVIMANNATLAGHVTVGDFVVIGGLTPIHQYCRIGSYAMVGAFSPIGQDVPPFTLGSGYPYKVAGLNLVGLKRNQISLEVRKELTKAFKITYRSLLPLQEALKKIEEELEMIPEIKLWIDFCKTSKRGLIGFQKKEENSSDEDLKDIKEVLKQEILQKSAVAPTL